MKYIYNSELDSIVRSFEIAINTGNIQLATNIKNTVKRWWNSLNSGLIDVESMDYLYNQLVVMTKMLERLQATGRFSTTSRVR